jgi:hypothetical protein
MDLPVRVHAEIHGPYGIELLSVYVGETDILPGLSPDQRAEIEENVWQDFQDTHPVKEPR